MSRIRILLADSYTVVRAGLRTLLEPVPDLEVVADTADGHHALREAVRLRPDVAILDLNLPEFAGVEVIGRLRSEAPEVRVLVLSANADCRLLRQALRAGARGYLLKQAAAEEVVRAVRMVAGGGRYLDSSLAAHIAEEFVEDGASSGPRGPALSEREAAVLRLIARGYANKEVAARLRVSVKTVETYKTRSMGKLDLRSRVDVVRHALKQGWLAEE